MTLDDCDHLFATVHKAASPAEACHALTPLFEHYEVISIELMRGIVFWRARVAADRPWQALSEMGYPPAPSVRPGRLNDEHSPCLYAATRVNTALAEISVQAGDFVQIAGFRIKRETPIRIAVVGELYHAHKMGYLRLVGTDPGGSMSRYLNQLGFERGERVLYIDAFLASLLADADLKQTDYILSRAVASMIYRNAEIDGIMFPSVRDLHGMNLALKPFPFDSKVHPVCCLHARIKKLRSFGFLDYEVTSEAARVSTDGMLHWRNPQPSGNLTFFNLTKDEYDEAMRSNGSPDSFLNVMSAHNER